MSLKPVIALLFIAVLADPALGLASGPPQEPPQREVAILSLRGCYRILGDILNLIGTADLEGQDRVTAIRMQLDTLEQRLSSQEIFLAAVIARTAHDYLDSAREDLEEGDLVALQGRTETTRILIEKAQRYL